MEQQIADDRLIADIATLARRFATHIVDDDAAEDIAQDVALQCLIVIREGRWRIDAAEVPDFVRRVVRRKAVDRLRRSQARERRHDDYARETHASPTWMSPELAYEERELAELHALALGRLPARCRRTYLMVRDEGETYESAASRLGVRPTTVSAHVVTAHTHLRRALASRGISAPVRHSPRARRRKRRSRRTPHSAVKP